MTLSAAGLQIHGDWFRRRFIPWSEVRSLETAPRSFGRTTLWVQADGRRLLPAPLAVSTWWGLFDDPEFDEKVVFIGRWRDTWTPPSV